MEISLELVGIRIMQKRKEHGYSQEELAELIEVSKNHLSSMERGHYFPTAKVVKKICNTLGGTFDYYYLGRIDEESEEEIIKLFEKLSQDEQKIAIELLNVYINNKRKFD